MAAQLIGCPVCDGNGHLPLSARLRSTTREAALTVLEYEGYSLRKRQIAATVLRLGNVDAAAAHLGISQARISQVLRGAERS